MTAIDEVVNRFLCWKLPQDFYPDCGITFQREGPYEHPVYGRIKYEPTGTNLLHAGQAKAMFEHCLQGLWPEQRIADLENEVNHLRAALRTANSFLAEKGAESDG